MPKNSKLVIEVWRGMVVDVRPLPKGWCYFLRDKDVGWKKKDEKDALADSKCLIIDVKGGAVEDASNLPKGYTYSVKETI